MSRYVQLTFPAGRPSYGSADVPPTTLTLALDKDGSWRIKAPLPPAWKSLVPDWAGGRYSERIGDLFTFYGVNRDTVFEIRRVSERAGPAFYGLRNGFFIGEGRWEPAPIVTPKNWVGVAVKADAGLIYQGEQVFLALVNCSQSSHGCSLRLYNHRIGVTGGFTGGVAVAFASGFSSSKDLDGFFSDGFDFSLSIGPKLSSLIKAPKLMQFLKAFEQGLKATEDVIRRLKDSEKTKELVGVGKGIMQAYFIDDEYQSLSIIDVPLLGAGAEAGIYYNCGTCRALSTW